jgi:hypothetical protein
MTEVGSTTSGRQQTIARASQLDPERTARMRQAILDDDLALKLRRIEDLEAQMRAKQAETKFTSQSSTYRGLAAEREQLIKETSTTAAQARRDIVLQTKINPGNITFVKGLEDDMRTIIPNMDESLTGRFNEFPPGEAEKLILLQSQIRRMGGHYNSKGEFVNGTEYTLKVVPENGTPYYQNQGEVYKGMMQGKMAMQDTLRDKVTSRVALAQSIMFGPGWTRKLSSDFRQSMYDELLNAGATPTEVNQFIAALRHQWENQPYQVGGAKIRKDIDVLGASAIRDISRGKALTKEGGKPMFAGFGEATLNAIPDMAQVVRRSGSRTYRALAKKYPATDGSGNLGHLIDQFYGREAGGLVAAIGGPARTVSYVGGVAYHTFRFVLDPRWYAMNLFEADFLAMARYGWKARKDARSKTIMETMLNKPGKPIPKDPAIERLRGGSMGDSLLAPSDTVQADAFASGWMDPRQLYGYIRNISNQQRRQITGKKLDELLQQMTDESSDVIKDLEALWGKNPKRWVEEIDDMLYSIDTRGVRPTVLEEAAKVGLTSAKGPVSQAYDDFLQGILEAHTKSYQDIVHTFHGNVNRSNIERIMNSPFLWWPLSYQLKTGKWVIDVMTKQMGGIKGPEMLGTFTLAALLGRHNTMMENNEEYAKIFNDHPAAWRMLGMLLPMTPFDMGAFMARWTRYSGSWIGAQLGLWDQDESYPQDLYNFVIRSLSLGPVFSQELMQDILKEFE